MASFDATAVPRCTIDFPLEISSVEIVSLSGPINTLLKSTYLLGSSSEIETTINSLFDIAKEIAGIESCGLLSCLENDPSSWEVRLGRHIEAQPSPEKLSFLIAPAAIVAHFGKAVSMDPDWGAWSAPICEAWSSRSLVAFPMRSDRDITSVVVFGKRESHPFTPVQMKLLWALALQAETHMYRSGAGKPVSTYAFLDPLTHLYNLRYFDHQLEKEIFRSRRNGEPFSLLTLDLDGFKSYNDRFLQSSGDIALQEFAGILSGSVREVDTVARLGGDEFGILLLEGNTEGAQALAQRIIQRLQRHLLPGKTESRTEQLSVSIGAASFPSDSFEKADLVSKADRALQVVRSNGGGQFLTYHEISDPRGVKNVLRDLPVRKIYEAGRSVVDMDKFLEILLFTGMQGLSAGRGSIVVKDAEGDFTLRTAIGFPRHEEHITATRGFRAGPITAWVMEHQLPLIVSKPEDSPFGGPFKKNGYQTESFLSIPLTHRGHTFGALHLTNRRNQLAFTHEDLKAFAPIASEIAAILAQGIGFRENVRTFSLSILTSLSDALELRFPFLSGHSNRVRDLTTRIGERMGLAKADLSALRHAAELHDVGIVGIPGNILSKKRRLNDLETEMVRMHPFLGSKMLEGVPGMDATRRSILEHHEHFDGSGYPYGLRGDDISLSARILSVTEFYDSAVSARPYRGAIPAKEALHMVSSSAGTLFDPEVAQLFTETVPPN
jgi:diguanylate cyclase (GGDEF)-like protein